MTDTVKTPVLPRVANDVSVVIPTIGRIDLLKNCLLSIASGSVAPGEILLGDQSDDTQVAELARQFARDLPVRNVPSGARGIAANLNQLLAEATNELVLVTHDDCRVATDWICRGRAALTAQEGALVTGRVLPGGHNHGVVPSTIVQTEAEDLTGSKKPGRLYPANMGLYRSAALSLDGFDERAGFSRAAEDLDFAYRWLQDGRMMRYEPSMVVIHEDWRDEEGLTTLYNGYARSAGRFFGKHLYSGDRYAGKMAINDIRTGLAAWKARLRKHRSSSEPRDPRLSRPVWIPVGVVEGLWESWRIDRQRELAKKANRS